MLCTQSISLLHAETVLFVHYHHAEGGGISTASCNSAWVPMTMPASPVAVSSRTFRF